MKVSKDEHLTQAYVLTAEELEKIYNVLQQYTEETTCELRCSDGIKREFSNLPDLLSFENPPHKEIQALRISSFSMRSSDVRVWIKFDKDSRRNIYLSVEGNEEPVIKIIDVLEERLASMRPWYAVFARTDITWLLLALLLAFNAGMVVASAFGIEIFSSQSINSPGVWVYFIGLLLGLIPIILGAILNRIKRFLFPMSVFALGQGLKRYNDRDFLRTTVFIGFIISFASSIAAALVLMFMLQN